MVKLPSAGKLNLAFKCLGSVLLPKVVDEAGPEAEKGKELHAKLEKFIKAGRKAPDGTGDDDIEFFSRAVRSLREGAIDESAEFGMAVRSVDWATSRYDPKRLESNDLQESSSGMDAGGPTHAGVVASSGSDNSAGVDGVSGSVGDAPSERDVWFVAVADLIQRFSSTEFAIYDWKSSNWVQEPQYNWQFLLPAIWLYISSGLPASYACHASAVFISTPDESGGFKRSYYCFTAADCERAMVQLGRLYRDIRSASNSPETVTLYEGKHCGYCPARHRCPAKVGSFVQALLTMDPWRLDKIADETIIAASRSLVDNMPQLKKMEINILKEHGGELDLGDGRIAVLTKDYRDKDKVYTKHASKTGSNASENGDSGKEGGRDSPAEGVRGSGEDSKN